MSDWKPIASAPRDGSTIVVANETESDAAYWDYDDWCAPNSSANSIPYEPTQWTELPKPSTSS